MPLATLSTGDGGNGQQLQAWVGEFTYAMGTLCNFDAIGTDKRETIVLSLNCVPSEWRGFTGTGRKGRGANREFWSSARVDYEHFNAGEAEVKIDAIARALRMAIEQVPPNKLAPGNLESFMAAVDFAAKDLRARPERHPRKVTPQ